MLAEPITREIEALEGLPDDVGIAFVSLAALRRKALLLGMR